MSNQILTQQDISAENVDPQHRAGTYLNDWMGRTWVYVQAGAAITHGAPLMPIGSGTVRNADISTAAATGTRRVYGNGDFSTVASDDVLVDGNFLTENGHTYYLWTDAGGSQGQGGPIYNWVDDTTVDVYFVQSSDGSIDTAFTTDTDFVVTTWSRVVDASAGYRRAVVGVSQIAVTDEYWFWALARGTGVVDVDTSDSTIEVMGWLVPSASTAGEAEGLEGHTVTSSTAATGADIREIGSAFAIAYSDTTADGLILANMMCPIFGDIPIPTNKGRDYPSVELLKG